MMLRANASDSVRKHEMETVKANHLEMVTWQNRLIVTESRNKY